MKQLINSVITLFLIANTFVSLIAQDKEVKFDNILNNHFSIDGPGVAVLIAIDDNVVYRKGIGYSDLDKQIPINPDNSFRIGSITKQFTAMAILKLVDEDKLSLTDSIQKYIPGFGVNTKPITIHHLLNHTSGLQNQEQIKGWGKYSLDPNASLIRTIEFFKNDILASVPGSKFQYSNLGYLLLTYVIELVSGESYADYLDTNFIKPLELTKTYYGDKEQLSSNGVIGYSSSTDQFYPAQKLNMNLPQGAGGLSSSIDDLYKWNLAVFDSERLGKYVGEAHLPSKLNNGQISPYGFGWQLGEVKGRKSIRHDGIINGYVSYQIYLPEEKAYATILTNCDCTRNIAEVAAELIAEAVNDPYSHKIIDLSDEQLLKYKGIYVSDSGQEQIVNFQDGALYFYPKGGSKIKLNPIGGHKFFLENSLSELTFKPNEKGEFGSFNYATIDDTELWVKVANTIALRSIEKADNELSKYCGKYQVPNAFTLVVSLEGNQLYGTVGNDRKTLSPYAEHSFFANENDILLLFRKEEMDIEGVTIIQNQKMFAAKTK